MITDQDFEELHTLFQQASDNPETFVIETTKPKLIRKGYEPVLNLDDGLIHYGPLTVCPEEDYGS